MRLEIEAYLEQSKGVVVLIDSTEQHGPNGLIGTDVICAEEIAPLHFHDARDYRRRFPDRRISSNPALSTPEDGERLYLAAVDGMAQANQAFVAEL